MLTQLDRVWSQPSIKSPGNWSSDVSNVEETECFWVACDLLCMSTEAAINYLKAAS